MKPRTCSSRRTREFDFSQVQTCKADKVLAPKTARSQITARMCGSMPSTGTSGGFAIPPRRRARETNFGASLSTHRLLIFSFFLSLFFASLVASYLHQLLNPQLLRTHVAVAGSSQYAYPLQPYPNVAPYPPAGGQQYYGGPAPPPGYAPGGLPVYSNEGGYEMPRDDKTPGPDPFADRNAPQLSAEEREQMQHDEEMRRRAMESTETVTLEPRRENEGRV